MTKFIIFLLINFAALAIGGIATGKGVVSDWYFNLNKAPWTPPGWFFGFAWTTIMICFSVYLAQLWPQTQNKNQLLILFAVQWVLNVAWNPVFFSFQQSSLALVLIIALTVLVGFILFFYWSTTKWIGLLLLPYFVWLIVATSLNAYIVMKN